MSFFLSFFFFQAEDGIRYLVRSRGLGDVYKRQDSVCAVASGWRSVPSRLALRHQPSCQAHQTMSLLHPQYAVHHPGASARHVRANTRIALKVLSLSLIHI